VRPAAGERMSDFDNSFRLLQEAAELFLRDFAKHLESQWQLTEQDTKEDETMTPEFVRGWNAAMTSGLESALHLFLDEFTP
jgi:hypothetical protein